MQGGRWRNRENALPPNMFRVLCRFWHSSGLECAMRSLRGPRKSQIQNWREPCAVFGTFGALNAQCGRRTNPANAPEMDQSPVLFFGTFRGRITRSRRDSQGDAGNRRELQVGRSLRAPVGCVIVHTKRVYRATPPPAAYTERPIRVAWNTSKGWRGVPYPLGRPI